MAVGAIRKIVRASGVRYEVVHDRGVDPITGKRRQESRTFKTRKEAEAYLRARQLEIDQGTAVDNSKMTLAEYLRHWLEASVQPRVRPSTYVGYERLIRVQLIPRIGAIPLQKLTALHVQSCYTAMRADPRADGKAGRLSPRGIQYAHTVRKMALKQAVRWRLVPHNVAADVDPPRATRPVVRAWNAEEAQHFLTVAEGDAYSPLWCLALSSGMRIGELRGLRWCDVDLGRGAIHVRQQITRVNRQDKVSAPKTRAGRRSIKLPPECAAALRTYYARRTERPVPLSPSLRDADLIFAQPDGSPLSPDMITDRFERLVAAAGVTRITFHGLRHTHATLSLLAGANIKAVSARRGHSSIQITLDTYAHVLPQMEDQAADAIGRMLWAG